MVITGPDAGLLLMAIRAGLRAAERNGFAVPSRLVAAMAGLEVVDQGYRDRAVSATKPQIADLGFAARQSERSLLVADVARRAGVTAQAVRKAARSGRLAGRRDGREWTFTETDAAAWIAARRKQGPDGQDGDAK
jgi:hypothetical protein